ncbi:MAG TPA: tetratricopeptide repeat protein [Gemmatimonadales bacterium]|nr:tetratricopeptide repeat protein [Gemmatimonadales bacterium]
MKRTPVLALVPACVLLTVSLAAATGDGKIPVTTVSDAARKEFLQGRELADNLRLADAIAHFDKAIALDPNFASAELARANVAPTVKDFQLHLDRAVALSSKASEGERLAILAAQAGSVGNAAKVREYLERSATLFPKDERAQFAVGAFYQGQQELPKAIAAFKAAIAIAPEFPPAYNNLGYAYRTTGDYAGAEAAFKKYAELIPNDPNPYDSYGELLMKLGRFDESMTQYRKALALDPHFIASRIGLAMNALYTGKPEVATSDLNELYNQARNDGERRQALFVQAVVDADQGKLDEAVHEAEQEFGIAERLGDAGAMTQDLNFKANILLGEGKADQALATFEKAQQTTDGSNLSPAVKQATRLFHHSNLAAVAIARNDLATARAEADSFAQASAGNRNGFQIRLAHELAGRIALAAGQYDAAITELLQANLQDPYNLYRLALAYRGKGDAGNARDYAGQAAHWNSLPAINYALVRTKALRLMEST